MPTFEWWVYVFLLRRVAEKAWNTFEALQNHDLLLNAQYGHLNKLRDELLGLVDGKGPNRAITNAEKDDISAHPGNWVLENSRDGSEFAVSVVKVYKLQRNRV